KGLFVKELETALAEARADLAVHSMKDVPAELPPGFSIAAIPAREDPRDVLVSKRFASLAEMPAGGTIGTSSLRRSAQIVERYPALDIRLLRGNVDTRLAKLDRGDYDAIVLAVAGLKRLGLEARATARLSADEMLPAPGQGALGIECLAAREELVALLAPLADGSTTACVLAERAVSRALGGNCSLPLAAFAQANTDNMRLRALVASADGRRVVRCELEGDIADPLALGERAAQELRRQGASEILGFA
ncbi:MAG TPA: hydroxymethylbilane synthase, partial [Burkholderiales bacterium]|nr:hydroxymethylbilane synthase [Burkholderiales bacterium]